MLVVDIEDGPIATRQRAALVFHVGSENIASKLMENGELGFYTEIDSVVSMFCTTAESLHRAEPAMTHEEISNPSAATHS
jgi:hypothetical protein